MPQSFWFSLYIHLFSNNLCLSTTCCQEQSDVPDDYSLAKISVHLSQSSIYNWYSSLYESLVSMKLLITFWLWAHRAFTDPGIHPVCLYSQKQSNTFLPLGVLTGLWFGRRCNVFISSLKLGAGRGIVLLPGLNHSPLHSSLLKSEHVTHIFSQNSEMHIFCCWCAYKITGLVEGVWFSCI